MPRAVEPCTRTWSEIRDNPGLEAFCIRIDSFGEQLSKQWLKSETSESHWDRIVSIAETSFERYTEHPGQGFSWVSVAAINGEVMKLTPPEWMIPLMSDVTDV